MLPLLNKVLHCYLLRESFKCNTHLTLSEKIALYSLSKNCTEIAEIGSYLGASTCCLGASSYSKPRNIYCIDTWNNDSMAEGRWDTWATFRKNTKSFSSLLVPLRGRSSDMVDHLRRYTNRLDLLFIDGAHDFDSVLEDWLLYKNFLDLGSIVVFHDSGWAEGVQRVVNELVAPIVSNPKSLPNMWWGSLAIKP